MRRADWTMLVDGGGRGREDELARAGGYLDKVGSVEKMAQRVLAFPFTD